MTQIPKTIHQIWIGNRDKPHYWSDTWQHSFLEKYPDYKYVLWDNENTQRELKKYPPLEMMYNHFQHYCYKADILRYIILHEYGGIYIDIDSIWNYKQNFDEIIINSIDKDNLFISETPNENKYSKCYLTNNVIGCNKNNIHMKEILNALQGMLYNYHSRKYDIKILKNKNIETSTIVGPGLVTRILKNKSINILPTHYFNPISWHKIDMSNIRLNMYNNSIMIHCGLTTNNLNNNENTNNVFNCGDVCVYWINLNRSIERRNHMYFLFATYFINNKRIEAYDGKEIDTYNNLDFEVTNKNINNYEYCCTFSHLKSIKTAYDNGDKMAIISEDDLCLDYYKKWKHNITEIINIAPEDWEIIKLHCNYEKHINKLIKRHNTFSEHRTPFFWKWENRSSSALLYIINRNGMKKIIEKFLINNKWKLTDAIASKAEYTLYNKANTYDYMLPFGNHLINDSNINNKHINVHIEGSNAIKNYFDNI